MGSAQSARRIQLGGSGRSRRGVADLLRRGGPSPARARLPPGAFPPLVVRRDRLWVGWEGRWGRWLVAPAASVTAPRQEPSPFPGVEGSDRCRAFRPREWGRTGSPCSRCDCRPGWTVLSAPQPRLAVEPVGATSRRQGSAAMSVTHPTRLETRTKESNTCASQWVSRNPTAQ